MTRQEWIEKYGTELRGAWHANAGDSAAQVAAMDEAMTRARTAFIDAFGCAPTHTDGNAAWHHCLTNLFTKSEATS
jgi:hypothetical protein